MPAAKPADFALEMLLERPERADWILCNSFVIVFWDMVTSAFYVIVMMVVKQKSCQFLIIPLIDRSNTRREERSLFVIGKRRVTR